MFGRLWLTNKITMVTIVCAKIPVLVTTAELEGKLVALLAAAVMKINK